MGLGLTASPSSGRGPPRSARDLVRVRVRVRVRARVRGRIMRIKNTLVTMYVT